MKAKAMELHILEVTDQGHVVRDEKLIVKASDTISCTNQDCDRTHSFIHVFHNMLIRNNTTSFVCNGHVLKSFVRCTNTLMFEKLKEDSVNGQV